MSEGLWRDRFLAIGDILGQEIEVARERREVIREIGIRMALGARRLDVLGQVLLSRAWPWWAAAWRSGCWRAGPADV